jgi:hypothetical protein
MPPKETKEVAVAATTSEEVSYGTSRPNRAWVCKPAPDFKELDVCCHHITDSLFHSIPLYVNGGYVLLVNSV